MGTIVDKFNYSFEAKDLIKDSINNLGGSITSETELKEYAQELDNIYDNLPKTTGEDTNLSLNTIKGKMNIIPKGDTQQDTTQGYQLLNSTLATSTQGTIAVTNNGDGSYTLNGTANSTVAVKIGDGITLENGSDYTLFVFNESTIGNTSTSGTWCDLRLSNSSGNIINGCSVAWGTANAKVTKNITSDYTNAKVEFRVGSGITLNNFKIKPMLIKGNDTTKTFEKYTGNIASPNPTYPQNIEVVTGTQEVKVENVNLLNYNTFVKGRINSTTGQIEYASNTTNITATENTISFTTTQAWNSGIASEFIKVGQGSYTYSIKSATLKASVYIDLYDKDQNFISRLGNKVINANEQTTWQVTISNTSAKYIRLHYEMGYADTITLTETQLEKRKYIYTIYTTPRTNTNNIFRRYRTS